jgi:hypothetical protein
MPDPAPDGARAAHRGAALGAGFDFDPMAATRGRGSRPKADLPLLRSPLTDDDGSFGFGGGCGVGGGVGVGGQAIAEVHGNPNFHHENFGFSMAFHNPNFGMGVGLDQAAQNAHLKGKVAPGAVTRH